MEQILEKRPISQAVYAAALERGFTKLQAHIIAGRLTDAEAGDVGVRIHPKLVDLNGPANLPDIDAAVDRLTKVVLDQEVIACCTDFDADGVSSQCVI